MLQDHRWSQDEAFAYPAEQWQPGRDDHPAGRDAGSSRCATGRLPPACWSVRSGDGNACPALDRHGNYRRGCCLNTWCPGPGWALCRTILPAPPFALDEVAAPNLQLTGYERGPHQVFTGDSWGMALWWLASGFPTAIYLTLDLLDASGAVHSLLETQPVYDTYPFDRGKRRSL